MGNQLLKRVRETRVSMRKQQLYLVFEDFDKECMQLTLDNRREKYAKMLESPFRFFRGSAYLFYSDLVKIPSIFHTSDERPIWIMGDMHMDNFGAFENEAGQIVYDVNDFDEGYVGSYLYDIMRMSVSIALYMEEQKLSSSTQEKAIRQFATSYLKQLRRFKQGKDNPATLMFTKENTTGPIKKVLKKLESKQRTNLVEDLTQIDEVGKRSFIWTEEVQKISEQEYTDIQATLPQYAIKDIAIKYGSGTASIGLKRYYILVGANEACKQEDLLLEMKEVRTAIPAYFLHYNERFWKHYAHQGARVVGTQKAMHHLEDPYLAYVTMNDTEYYIRERSPFKKKVKPKNYKAIEDYYETTEIMGKVAAKIHARADNDYSELIEHQSEKEILSTIGDYQAVFIDFLIHNAMAYKDIVNQDYQVFKQWIERPESQLNSAE
ncbi:MAG: DUF2252 family protein [Kurthia sp.]|nr:DUF2252 family protein [Candidatus Kurthia equi]